MGEETAGNVGEAEGAGGKAEKVKEEILKALEKVIDPELGLDVVNLGLIYGIDVDEEKREAVVRMTMTSPACPVAGKILEDVQKALEGVESIENIRVELVWDPPWSPERITKKGRILLGLE